MSSIIGPHPQEVHRNEKSKAAHEKKMRRLHFIHKYKIREICAFSVLGIMLFFAAAILYVFEVEIPAKEARLAQFQEESDFILWLESEANIETAKNDCLANEELSYYDCFHETVQKEVSQRELSVKTIEQMISIGVGLIYKMAEEQRLKQEAQMPAELRVPDQLRSETSLQEDMNVLHWYLFCLNEISKVKSTTALGFLEKHSVFNRVHSITMGKVSIIDTRLGALPDTYKAYEDQFFALKRLVESLEGQIYSVSL